MLPLNPSCGLTGAAAAAAKEAAKEAAAAAVGRRLVVVMKPNYQHLNSQPQSVTELGCHVKE
jgi:hypothetical protein